MARTTGAGPASRAAAPDLAPRTDDGYARPQAGTGAGIGTGAAGTQREEVGTLVDPRAEHRPARSPGPSGDRRRGARERVVVAVSGGPGSETVIRRGMRAPERGAGGELLAVHVVGRHERRPADPVALVQQRRLVEFLGGSWHTVLGDDVAAALLDFAHRVGATRLVLGAGPGRPFARLLRPGVGARVLDGAGGLDVHLVPHARVGAGGPRRRRAAPLATTRRLAAWVLAVGGSVLLTVVFLRAGTGPEALALNFLCHLTLVVFVAILGGWWPALAAAVLGVMLVNWFFTPPTGMLMIHEPLNIVALGLFLLVAAGVARVVDVEARRTAEAGSARHRAAMLFELASGVISEGLSVQALLDRLRQTYALRGVALVERPGGSADPAGERVVAASGATAPDAGACAGTVVVDPLHVLLIDGLSRETPDQDILEAFAGRIGHVLQQQALDDARLQARELAAGNSMRTALLAAVSHDLRTPLAGIKASVSSLRMQDVVLSAEDQRELLANVEEAADQLTERIDDLLDMSRIESGRLVVHRVPLDPADLVDSAVRNACGADQLHRVDVGIPLDTPPVLGDHGLLVRIIANLVENALKHGGSAPVAVRSSVSAGAVELRVIDHGPGVPAADRERIFQPFQRLGDRDNTAGVGLGLAVARGLAEGVGGRVHAEDTPGGGLTMVLTLRAAQPPGAGAGTPPVTGDGVRP